MKPHRTLAAGTQVTFDGEFFVVEQPGNGMVYLLTDDIADLAAFVREVENLEPLKECAV